MRKSGAWYTYDGDQLGQGKENSRNFLLENPAIALDIEKKIMVKLGIGAEAVAAAAVAKEKAAQDAAAEGSQVAPSDGPVLAVQPKATKTAPVVEVPVDVAAEDEEFPAEADSPEFLSAVGE